MKIIYKSYKSKKCGNVIKAFMAGLILFLVFHSVSFAEGGGRYTVNPWSFGVHGDTQFYVQDNDPGPDNPDNPNYVNAAVIGKLNEEFIKKGVKFVLQVGDLTDRAGDDAMYTRADAAQPLYDKGIGFFPLRGNHETYGWLYGLDPEWNLNIPAYLDAFPQTQGISYAFGAYNFSSPAIAEVTGLSYSFDYGDAGNNARFVIVDVEATNITLTDIENDPNYHPELYGEGWYYLGWIIYVSTDTVPGTIPAGVYFRISSSGAPSINFYGFENTYPIEDWKFKQSIAIKGEVWPGAQQDWISAQLGQATRGTEHAFVFSHRPLIGGDHVDCFFGANANTDTDDQNVFYASLMDNGVKYMISGHDHFYNRALLASPDGNSQVEQLISIGASTKFYGPASLDEFPDGVKERETEISQEANNNIGFYIYTVDGPRVMVDYYSDAVGGFQDADYYPDGDPDADPPVLGSLEVPDFDFVKKETWGYSLNGKQFRIAQGESYAVVEDSYFTTAAKILAGKNSSTTEDATPTVIDDNGTPEDPSDDIVLSAPRPLNKTVNTGWVEKPGDMFGSDIFSLWGLGELGEEASDVYVLQLTYVDNRGKGKHNGNGGYRLCAIDKNGHWRKAVDFNIGKQKKKFIEGPYKKTYGLGTYGIDQKSGTVWAVLNYVADFAVVKGKDK